MGKRPEEEYEVEIKTAEEVFTDREEPVSAFWKIYNQMEPGCYDIINYYGIGGIGKTSLLVTKLQREIRNKVDSKSDICAYYNFEKNQQKSDFLFILSRQIMLRNKGSKFPVFDYAFEKWMRETGKSQEEINSYIAGKENEIFSIEGLIDKAGAIASDVLPFMNITTTMAKGVIGFLEKSTHRNELASGENARIVYEINCLQGVEIETRLEKFFAHDAKKILREIKTPFVIMLDGYEALVNKLGQGDKARAEDNWLHEPKIGLVRKLPNVLWVVAGREKLHWEEDILPNEQTHLMGQISLEDAKLYFHKIGIFDEKMIAGLHKLTSGTPVYMDWCYKQYIQLQREKGYEIKLEDFGSNTTELAKRYLRDMKSEQQDVVYLLSCLPDIWNDEMVNWVAKKTNYQVSINAEYKRIKGLSLIEKIGDEYKIHETFRNVVLNFMEDEDRGDLSEAVWEYYIYYLDCEHTDEEKADMVKRYVQSFRRIGKYTKWNEEKLEKMLHGIYRYAWRIRNLDIVLETRDFVNDIMKDEKNKCCILAQYIVTEFYMRLQEYKKAKEIAENEYAICIEAYGEDNKLALSFLGRLAVIYEFTKDYEKGKEAIEKKYEGYKRMLGAAHKETLEVCQELIHLCNVTGNYERKKELVVEVCEMRDKMSEENSYNMSMIHYEAAKIYQDLGNYEKALEILFKVFKEQHNFFEGYHFLLNETRCRIKKIKGSVSDEVFQKIAKN